MAIRDKDGKVYKLRGPNPLMNGQSLDWDKSIAVPPSELPEFLVLEWNVPFYFGGTSLLIIVVVTMDFMAQVQAYVMSHQYESLLKKSGAKRVGV